MRLEIYFKFSPTIKETAISPEQADSILNSIEKALNKLSIQDTVITLNCVNPNSK